MSAARQPRERTRPVRAVLDGDELVVSMCPYCRQPHYHGGADEAVGTLTWRESHCVHSSRPYALRVIAAPRRQTKRRRPGISRAPQQKGLVS